MANVKRIKANKAKYADRELLTYEEAMDYLGTKRSTLYAYATDLDIETKKFKRDRRRYFRMEDVQLLDKALHVPGFFDEELKCRQALKDSAP